MDRIVVFVDRNGVPVLPDLAAARARRLDDPPSLPPNRLTFTYNSPSDPWTASEMTYLTNTLHELYPLMEDVYGEPAFSNVVNIRKDTNLSYAGVYSASINELVMRSTNADVLCHEIIHGFRDDNIIWLSSFEEGMTRAAEVEVFARSFAYTHAFDENHSDSYDVYYEGMNRPAVGAPGGNIFAGYIGTLVRYQLAGYAWAKPLLQNTNFFRDFNKDYYAAQLADPATHNSEAKLLAILTNVQDIVEGRTFMDWYTRQCILNTNPPLGYQLYQRLNQYTVDYFYRSVTGSETMRGNAEIRWAVYGHTNQLLSTGTNVTGSFGWTTVTPALPVGYEGRLKITVTTTSPSGTVSDTVFRPAGSWSNVFGIVSNANTGWITVYPLDNAGDPLAVRLTNGVFCFSALNRGRGRYVTAFTDSQGRSRLMHFTRDAGNYFLSLCESNMASFGVAGITTTGDDDMLITCKGLGLCSFVVQTCAGSPSNFVTINKSRSLIPGTGESTATYMHSHGATNSARCYRVELDP